MNIHRRLQPALSLSTSPEIKKHALLYFGITTKHFGVVGTGIARFGLDWMWRESTALLQAKLSEVKIFSMTKRWNNMSMWAKYADNHKGYCLEFANAGLFAAACEVEYGDVAAVDVADTGSFDIAFFFRKRHGIWLAG